MRRSNLLARCRDTYNEIGNTVVAAVDMHSLAVLVDSRMLLTCAASACGEQLVLRVMGQDGLATAFMMILSVGEDASAFRCLSLQLQRMQPRISSIKSYSPQSSDCVLFVAPASLVSGHRCTHTSHREPCEHHLTVKSHLGKGLLRHPIR